MSRWSSGMSVREGRFIGEATARTGRRRQKVLHNHPRKLTDTKKADLSPVTRGLCGKSPEAAFLQAESTKNVWPVKNYLAL